jgi:hypothetical protein
LTFFPSDPSGFHEHGIKEIKKGTAALRNHVSDGGRKHFRRYHIAREK